jgi:hypothetical protein
MNRFLKYIDWVLLVYNIIILLFILEALDSSYLIFTEDTKWGEFSRKNANFWFYGFMYIYPFIWCVLWFLRRYYKVKPSVIWLLNTLHFIVALLVHCMLQIPDLTPRF